MCKLRLLYLLILLGLLAGSAGTANATATADETTADSVSAIAADEDAVDADSLAFAPWPEKFDRSRKQIGGDSIASPWLHFILGSITEGEAYDRDVRPQDKCIVPAELVEVLQQATAYGRPLLDGEAHVLLPVAQPLRYGWFTPVVLALLLLAASVANVWLRRRELRVVLWGLYSVAGGVVTYLCLLSDLCCTQWSVLIVPFSVAPLLLWPWRRHWALPFAAIVVVWSVVLVCVPRVIVDPAHIIMALVVAAMALELRGARLPAVAVGRKQGRRGARISDV